MPAAAIPAIIGAAGSIGGALIGSSGAGKAADAQVKAAQSAADAQLQMYNQTREDQTPWRQAGGKAVGALSQFYGLGGNQQSPLSYSEWMSQNSGTLNKPSQSGYGLWSGGYGQMASQYQAYSDYVKNFEPSNQAPDYNAILQNQPGYQFQFDQGEQAVQRNLAARGLLSSGAGAKALTQYGQGMASNYIDKYVNGLQSLAGLGQTSAQATGNAGMNSANQMGSAAGYAGNAQATGYMNQANAWQQGLGGVAQAFGNYFSPQAGGGSYRVPTDISNMINTPVAFPGMFGLGGP